MSFVRFSKMINVLICSGIEIELVFAVPHSFELRVWSEPLHRLDDQMHLLSLHDFVEDIDHFVLVKRVGGDLLILVTGNH